VEQLAIGPDHVELVRQVLSVGGVEILREELDFATEDHERIFAEGAASEGAGCN
jgi:hypothetical protein